MKKDFDIIDKWVPHEIHPETPKEGQAMEERFSRIDIEQVTEACRKHGGKYGLEFTDMERLSNTRLALEGAEFAKEHDLYDDFHHAAFKAYFTDGRDIGDIGVLSELAKECGLDVDSFQKALAEGTYTEQVARGSDAARALGVTAIPAFFIEDQPPIIGAVTEDRFREALQAILERTDYEPLHAKQPF